MFLKESNNGTYFEETQRLPQIWYFVTIILNGIILGYFSLGNYFLSNNWFYNSISKETRIFIVVSIIVLTAHVFFSHLKIIIRNTGLTVYYWPFVNREIKFDEIVEYEVIRYKPMIDFGAWGIRNFEDHDLTFNVSGKQGIRLHLKNGHTMIVGSQMVNDLLDAIYQNTGKKEGTNITQCVDIVAI